MSRILLSLALSGAALSGPLSPVAAAGLTPGAGFSGAAVAAAPAGAFPGGMDLLPNGNAAIFDGAAVIEVDPSTGAVVKTIFTPPGFVFGSFVKTDPTGTYLLFGESSNHTITKIPLDGSPASVVATVTFNFDLTFDAVGVAYVSASPSFVTTQVYRLNLPSGTTDQILEFAGPSGPIAFDATNNLYYAEASSSFPAPQGQQTIYRFSKAQVQSATGPGFLTIADGIAFVPGMTSVADLAFDGQGDLLVSDSSEGLVREYDAGGNLRGVVGSEAPFNAVTTLAYADDAGASAFGAFQPADGGTLLALSTDFFSFNDLNVLTPARPTLGTTPASPVPNGPLTLDLAGGPALGTALGLVCAQGLGAEVPAYSNGTPLLVGVDAGALLGAFVLPLDAQGELSVAANHAGAPATIFVQAFVNDGGGFVGSSETAKIELQ